MVVIFREKVFVFLISVFLGGQVASAEVPGDRELLACYGPHTIVTDATAVKRICTAKIWALAHQTQDPEKLVSFAEIIYNVDSNTASVPFFELALKNSRQACGKPIVATVILDQLKKGQKDFLQKCSPWTGPHLGNLFLHAKDSEERKILCTALKSDLKKNKMDQLCADEGSGL